MNKIQCELIPAKDLDDDSLTGDESFFQSGPEYEYLIQSPNQDDETL